MLVESASLPQMVGLVRYRCGLSCPLPHHCGPDAHIPLLSQTGSSSLAGRPGRLQKEWDCDANLFHAAIPIGALPSCPPVRPVSVAIALSSEECAYNASDNKLDYYFFSWISCFGAHQGLSQGISFGSILGLLSAGDCLEDRGSLRQLNYLPGFSSLNLRCRKHRSIFPWTSYHTLILTQFICKLKYT